MGWQFEQVRHVFETLWPWARRPSGRPFVIVVVKGDRDLKALAPEFWENGRDGTSGVAVGGADRDYVALKAGVALEDELGNNPYYFAYWGYAVRMLEASFPVNLPLWYKRGLADLFANTIVRGKDVQVARPLKHHLRRMAEGQRIPLADLLAATRESKVYADEDWRPMFDAQSWMLVHYLLFGDKGAHRPKLNRFADLMLQGRKPEEALAEAMGPIAPLEKGYLLYHDRKLFQFVQLAVDLNVKKEQFPVRALPLSEAAALRAGFHVAMRRPTEARALLAEARRSEPGSVIAFEVEGVLLDREDKDKEALEAFTRAADGGSQNFWVHYRRATLLGGPNPSKEVQDQRLRSLTEAVRLNADHAWAQAELSRALTDLEPGDRAIAAASRAVSLEPGVVVHRLALIDALWQASRVAEARQQAAAALALPADAETHASVQEWVTHLNGPAGERGPTRRAGPASGAAAAETAGDVSADWVAAATEACESGTAAACAALASALERGQGVAADPARALTLYEKACAGERRACVEAGRMKFQGQGVPRDIPGARALAQRACDAGELMGCTTLAVTHLNAGTPEGVAMARTLLKQACDGGESNACDLLKSMPK